MHLAAGSERIYVLQQVKQASKSQNSHFVFFLVDPLKFSAQIKQDILVVCLFCAKEIGRNFFQFF